VGYFEVVLRSQHHPHHRINTLLHGPVKEHHVLFHKVRYVYSAAQKRFGVVKKVVVPVTGIGV
jgi:hypothetical protein